MWTAGKNQKPHLCLDEQLYLLYCMHVLLKMFITVHFLKYNNIIQQIQCIIGIGGAPIDTQP